MDIRLVHKLYSSSRRLGCVSRRDPTRLSIQIKRLTISELPPLSRPHLIPSCCGRLVKEVGRLKSEVSSAQRALNDAPYGVESLRAEGKATRRLLAERVRKVRAQQESGDEAVTDGAAAPSPDGDARDGDRESAVATDGDAALEPDAVEEGLEVEGPFDPTPELRSRFADKSNSLKFVTAEEDARMRREELVSVFAVRETTSAAAVDEADASGSVRQDSEDSRSQYSADSEKGGSPSGRSGGDKRVPADAAEVGARGDVKSRMKAFGAVLEKTLGKRACARAAQTPKRAGAASADAVGGGSPLRKGPVTPDKRVVTRCTPKSKLFKTISSPRSPSSLSACPVPPPPSASAADDGAHVSDPRARGRCRRRQPRQPEAGNGRTSGPDPGGQGRRCQRQQRWRQRRQGHLNLGPRASAPAEVALRRCRAEDSHSPRRSGAPARLLHPASVKSRRKVGTASRGRGGGASTHVAALCLFWLV